MNKIVIGQHVSCILYGGRNGIVTNIHGEQSPTSCRAVMGGCGVTGGSADLDIVWDNGTSSQRVPESLVRSSVQWTLHPEVASQAEVAAALDSLAVCTEQRQAADTERLAAFSAECARLSEEYPALKQRTQEDDSFKRALANMRILLKAAFPKVKFSVKQRYYGSAEIRWTDGPTVPQVEAITAKFQGGHFDGMEDIYQCEASPWTTVFGDCKYVSEYREISDELLQFGLDKLYGAFPGNLKDVDRPALSTLRSGNVPQIPGLGQLNLRDGAYAIVGQYDAINTQFVTGVYHRYSWLIEGFVAS